jgi:hypothetical protein
LTGGQICEQDIEIYFLTTSKMSRDDYLWGHAANEGSRKQISCSVEMHRFFIIEVGDITVVPAVIAIDTNLSFLQRNTGDHCTGTA